MMNNIAPGTLCLVIGGPDTGRSLTAVRVVDRETIKKALSKAVGFDVKVGFKECVIWEVDQPTLWVSNRGTHSCKIPYEMAENLLPIPPLADDKTTQQEREKPCTA